MADWSEDYAAALGFQDSEVTAAELRAAAQTPAAKLVRKYQPKTPAKPPLDKNAELEGDSAAPPSVVGEIIERDPAPSAVTFSIPKEDLLYGEAPVPKTTAPQSFAEPELNGLTLSANVDELSRKLQWTENCDLDEVDELTAQMGELRFNFDGRLIAPYTLDLNAGLEAAIEGDLVGLNCHGQMAHLPGYSIPELITLLTSACDQQVLISLRSLANVLRVRLDALAHNTRLYRLDYKTIYTAVGNKAVILADPLRYVVTDEPAKATFGFGFGLKRLNDYLTRSVMLHERLAVVALKSTKEEIVDGALMALSRLLTRADGRLSWERMLERHIGSHEFQTTVPSFLTSRRSVLRREYLEDYLLAGKDTDLSDDLKYYIVSDAVPDSADEQGEEVEAESLGRREDPLLSLLLWGERGKPSELLKLMVARLVKSDDSPTIVAILKILQSISLHSSFAANYLHNFIDQTRDQAGHTCATILCRKLLKHWLACDSSKVSIDVVVEFLRFLSMDSLACRTPLQSLLNTAEEAPVCIEGLVWKLAVRFFEWDDEQVPTYLREDVVLPLVLSIHCRNVIDDGCKLLPLYESLLKLFKDGCADDARRRMLSALMTACEAEFSVLGSQTALSIASLVSQQCQNCLSDFFEVVSVKEDPCLDYIRLAQKCCRFLSVIYSADESTSLPYHVLQRSTFGQELSRRLLDAKSSVERVIEVVIARLQRISASQIFHFATESLNLMDYTPLLVEPPTPPPHEDPVRLSHTLQFLVYLIELARSLSISSHFTSSYARLLEILRESARDLAGHVLSFPGRPRWGINTSDQDCFSLTNPLTDPWAQLFCVLVKELEVKPEPTDCIFYSCAFHLSTARQLVEVIEPTFIEDDWNILSSLACGYQYEVANAEFADSIISAERDAELLASSKLQQSRLLSTNFLQVFLNPFVGRVLRHIGGSYAELLADVGRRLLERSARSLSAIGFGSIWLYEFIETMTLTDLKIDWDLMLALQSEVLRTDRHFMSIYSPPTSSLGHAHYAENSPLLRALHSTWNQAYVVKTRDKLLSQLRSAILTDHRRIDIRVVWYCLLAFSSLAPLNSSPWLDTEILSLVMRLEPDEHDATAVCGIPIYLLTYQGNLMGRSQIPSSIIALAESAPGQVLKEVVLALTSE